MKLICKTFLYGLIQLVSIVIVFAPTLAQGKVKEPEVTSKPNLCLGVGTDKLVGSERAIQVILISSSVAAEDLAKYRLVFREKNGKH